MTEPAEFRIRSLTASVYIPTFLFAVGQGAAIPMLPLFALDLGLSVPVAGALVGLRALGNLVADVPAGILVARIGEKKAMLVASVVLSAVAIGIGLRPPAPVLAALVVLMGAAWSIWLLARLTYASEVAPAAMRGRVLSLLGGANRVGNLAGPLLGGVAVASFGLASAFYLQALFALVALASLAARTPPLSHLPGPEHASLTSPFRDQRRLISAVAAVAVAIQVVRSGRDAFFPLWGSQIGLTAPQVSLIFAAAAAAEMLLVYPAGVIMDRHGRKWTGVPCLLLMAAGLGWAVTTSGFASLLGAGLLFGLGNGLGSGIQMTLGSDVSPPGRRAAFLGVWRLTTDGGAVAGPVLVAAATSAVGLSLAAPLVAIVGVVGAGVLAWTVPSWLGRHPHHHEGWDPP